MPGNEQEWICLNCRQIEKKCRCGSARILNLKPRQGGRIREHKMCQTFGDVRTLLADLQERVGQLERLDRERIRPIEKRLGALTDAVGVLRRSVAFVRGLVCGKKK